MARSRIAEQRALPLSFTSRLTMLDRFWATGQCGGMKRHQALLAMILSVGCISSAEARLGETIAQCKDRYGPVEEKRPANVKESDPEALVFSKNGITTLIEFKKGVAWRIVFRLIGMSSLEVETLLKANMAEGGWGPALKINGQDFRISLDRSRIAVYSPVVDKNDVPALEIAAREYATANYAEYSLKTAETIGQVKEQKAGQDLKGF